MARKIKYTAGPMGKHKINDFKIVSKDFLPSPEELARRMDKTKITITLTSDSIDFFRKEAEKHGMQYQRMIRQVLDNYVTHYQAQIRQQK
jgi:predicted DNA binding CopG/RHH family protein